MKATLRLASDWTFHNDIEVNTLEDLLAIMDKYGKEYPKEDGTTEHYPESIILKSCKDNSLEIVVYDDYIE